MVIGLDNIRGVVLFLKNHLSFEAPVDMSDIKPGGAEGIAPSDVAQSSRGKLNTTASFRVESNEYWMVFDIERENGFNPVQVPPLPSPREDCVIWANLPVG